MKPYYYHQEQLLRILRKNNYLQTLKNEIGSFC